VQDRQRRDQAPKILELVEESLVPNLVCRRFNSRTLAVGTIPIILVCGAAETEYISLSQRYAMRASETWWTKNEESRPALALLVDGHIHACIPR
jgi:hypothetical protein